MGIESIVLELMERIKVLEKKVVCLEEKVMFAPEERVAATSEGAQTSPSETHKVSLTQSARDYINEAKVAARERGETSIVLLCNDIQKALHVTNRPRNICIAMYDSMTNPKDRVLSAPPSGFSTTVLVEYFLND